MFKLVCIVATLLVGSMFGTGAAATEKFPSRPVKLIVPFPPGGVTDIVGRVVAQKLSEKWGQPVVVENRAGAGGNIGTEMGARSVADGHTLTLGSIATAISQSLYSKLGYNMLRDFEPVTQLVASPLLLVATPSLAANNVQELIAYAKANPGKLSFASSGSGSSFHLAGEMLKARAGIDIVHVPYKGGAPATQDLMGGQVAFMFNNIVEALPHVRSGKLKALGATGAARAPSAPEIPTLVEQGLRDFVVTPWFGILVPKATPGPIVKQLNEDIVAVLKLPDVRERFATLGAEPVGSTQADFDRFVRAEISRWAEIVKASGARVD